MIRYGGTIIALLLALGLEAQVEVRCTVDSNRLLIGDQRTLRVQVQSREPISVDSLSFGSWQDLGVEMLEPQTWQGTSTHHQKALRFAVFDTGYIKLPSLPLVYQTAAGADTAYSDDLALEVSAIVVDSTGLAPIKSIIREPLKLRDFLPYLLALAGVGLIIALILMRKRRNLEEEIVIEVPIPPHEIALRALGKLKDKKLWQAGQIKQYQSELTHIIRSYLEQRYDTPALESTTSEILTAMKGKGLHESLLADLDQILNMADLIKFAKAKPEVDIHAAFMDKAASFVHQTKEITVEPVS